MSVPIEKPYDDDDDDDDDDDVQKTAELML